MNEQRRSLYRIAEAQRGLVTRADLRSIGVTRGQRDRLRAEGSLTPVGHRTFVIGGAAPDPRRELLAACLDTGGVASHRSAASLHGIPGIAAPRRPEVTVTRRGTPNLSDV